MSLSDNINIIGVIVNTVVAIATVGAVIAALYISNKQIKENRRQATEERQHQSRPVVVPISEVLYAYDSCGRGQPYDSGDLINWNVDRVKIEVHNMGNGPALDVHCVLFSAHNQYAKHFVSWSNGPVEGNGKKTIIYNHSRELCLNYNNTIDGVHPLYLYVLNAPNNPIARLTITYHDLFGIKHVSIFDPMLEHQWVHVSIDKIPALDLKELNDQEKQQAPTYSAPPAPSH